MEVINVIPEGVLIVAAAEIKKAEESLIKNALTGKDKADKIRAKVIQQLIDYATEHKVPRKLARAAIVDQVLRPAIDPEGKDIYGALKPKTVDNYGTSISRALERGIPYRHNLFTDPKYGRNAGKAAPKPETDSDLPSTGEGLAKGKREAHKPTAPKAVTRHEVASQATALVGALTSIGETEAAREIREILEDHNLWAMPKN